jgi:hypothetical protein
VHLIFADEREDGERLVGREVFSERGWQVQARVSVAEGLAIGERPTRDAFAGRQLTTFEQRGVLAPRVLDEEAARLTRDEGQGA